VSQAGAVPITVDGDDDDAKEVLSSPAEMTLERVRRHIRANVVLLEQLLMQQPVDVHELKKDLTACGIDLPLKQLEQFLESEGACVVHTSINRGNPRVKQRKPKRKIRLGPVEL